MELNLLDINGIPCVFVHDQHVPAGQQVDSKRFGLDNPNSIRLKALSKHKNIVPKACILCFTLNSPDDGRHTEMKRPRGRSAVGNHVSHYNITSK